ncbi:hypothetical protein Tco_0798870 [Tanacetum coccineum]
MIPATTPLLGFSGEISWPLGQISLMITLGDGEHTTSALMNFMVDRSPSPYNGIIGCPGLRKIQAVPSTAHGMLKFSVEGGIETIRSNTIIPAEYDWCSKIHSGTPLEHPRRMPTHKAKKKGASSKQEQSSPGGSHQVSGIRNHEGSTLPRLALKPSHGKETRWQLEDVCGLHRFKEIMPKRLLSPSGNRLEN